MDKKLLGGKSGLNVENLTISIKKEIVSHISFSIDQGECVGLLGESGSGKSLTALSILGLLPYPAAKLHSGSISFQGQELLNKSDSEMTEIRGTKIGMIFQDFSMALNPTMKIGKQIAEGLKKHQKLNVDQSYRKAIELLSLVGISDPTHRYHQYPFEFSGGMKQRVMIAIAISCDPLLIIADEPTSALDVSTQMQILKLLKKLQQEQNKSFLFITHDLGVAAGICDRILIMLEGKIVESGNVDQIFYQPQHPYTRKLLDTVLFKSSENINFSKQS